MRPLPSLMAGTSRWVLPMADRSAAMLALRLLTLERPWVYGALSPVLWYDPPLTVWAVCVAWRHSRLQPRDVRELAEWLAEHLAEVLQWNESELPTPAAADEQKAAYADRVEAASKLAYVAAALAGPPESAAADEAFLLGLLDDAGDWPSVEGDCSAEAIATILPEWLIQRHAMETQEGPRDGDATAAIRLARSMIRGETQLPESAKVDMDAIVRLAEERRRLWESVSDGLASLPQIAAKMGRLNQLERSFQETLETEKLEAMAEFAAGAGHEINNPLTVIAGRAQLFLHEETDPERRRALALISAQAMRVYEMIADMMLFARPPKPEHQPVELVKLIDEMIADFLPRATRQETTICRTGESEPILIHADPVQLNVALRAMCQNALESLGSGGHVEIEAEQEGCSAEPSQKKLPTPFVVIRIRDDGPGIKADERRHLFDPFYSARQAGRGLGMGLAKAWRIITNHGGRIEVASQPGRGAMFTITLPATTGHNDAPAQPGG